MARQFRPGQLRTGSLYDISSSFAVTASFITASNVYGPFGSNSVISASYADTASFSLATTENRILVLNQSGQNIAKGVVVHITASGNSSDVPRIITASFENDNNSANTLGIASQLITNGSTGFVTTEGVLLGVNTSAFQSGQLVYLGATGSITGSAPLPPLHSVRLGQVIRQQSNNGSIYVRIDNGYEIGELHDVRDTTTSSSFGDLLVKSGSIWINSKQLTGSYGLTGSLTATSFTGSLSGTATTASYVLNAVSASYATTASYLTGYISPFPYTGSAIISGSLIVTGSTSFTGQAGSTLFSSNADTLVVTGSILLTGSMNVVGLITGTSSYANQALSSSFATTASYILNAVSSSFATTASFAITASYIDGGFY